MKQVYSSGQLNSGVPSALRAATAGTGADDLSAALTGQCYGVPAGYQPDNERPLPIRLALLKTIRGRVLTHVTPHGGKASWFAHTLVNVPTTADAQLAIQTWGSPLWQKQDPESAADLPELPYLPVADVLDDAALKDWLKNPARQELLEFTLAALLGTPAQSRIFLAAAADDVAKVVYAATRVLPQGLLDDFTFSTYEALPLNCSARLIGCDSSEADLPEDCYAGADVGFNPAGGRRSNVAVDVPFAAFAVKAATAGEFAAVDEVKATWQRLGLRDPRQFDLVYRLTRGTGVMTKAEAAEMLQHPPLAVYVSSRADALNQFLDWALDDRDFAVSSFTRAAQALRQKPEMAAKLAQTVRDAGVKALKAGDVVRTSNALEVILPMVAPTKANAIWGELSGIAGDPTAVTWDMRSWLLPRFVRFKTQQGITGVDAGLQTWLDVPMDKLGALLALDLPRAYQLAAAGAALHRADEPSVELARTLAANPALTRTLLIPTTSGEERPAKLFEQLLAEAPHTPWLETLLANAGDYPAASLNRYFESALTAGRVDADRLIRTQGPQLLELFTGRSGLDKVGTLLLATPPADLLRQSNLLDFLGKLLDESQVGEALKTRIRAVQAVRGYLDAPSFDSNVQKTAAEALLLEPPAVPNGTKTEVFHAVADMLVKRADSTDLQKHLETTLVQFGTVLAVDSTDLYENLLRTIRGRTDFGRNANLVTTFLATALGAVHEEALAGKLDGLEGHAFAIAGDAAKRGGSRMLAEVDRRSAAWPKAARTQWGFLSAAVRPRGTADFLRDVGMVAAGMAAMGAVWLIVSLVR